MDAHSRTCPMKVNICSGIPLPGDPRFVTTGDPGSSHDPFGRLLIAVGVIFDMVIKAGRVDIFNDN